jgi:hypothetical protein
VILRLALRSVAIRPWRTAVLAAGFGLGIGVMAALLGVGEVIIEQAHAPALRGGGDLVVSSALGPVDNARFVLAHVLGAPDLRSRQAAASPNRRATLYLVKPGLSLAVQARGGVPSLERAVGDPEVAAVRAWTDVASDATWSSPRPEEILRAMDRFHAVPGAGPGDNSVVDRSSWAEWLYFNGRSPDGRLRFYLTFLAGPIDANGTRWAVVRLQLDRNGRSENYSAGALVDAADMLARAPDLDIAGNRVRLDGSRYRLMLALSREPGAGGPSRLDGEIVLDAPPGRSLPPAAIHGAHGWVSGYVVPVLSGPWRGALRIGGDMVSLEGASGYHDHNWGFWEGVRWQWGQVAGDDVSIVYGRVFPPAAVADPDRIPGVLGVLGPNGPIGLATDVTIAETDERGPRQITVTARGRGLDLRLTLSVEESLGTRMGLTRLASGQTMRFLQLGGTYRVTGRVGDRGIDFSARGSAETFRPNP